MVVVDGVSVGIVSCGCFCCCGWGCQFVVGGKVGDVGGVGVGVGFCGGPAWAPALLFDISSSSDVMLLKLFVLLVLVVLLFLLGSLSFFLGFFFPQIVKRGLCVGLAGFWF